MQAIEAAVAGRTDRPLLRNVTGRRMTAYNVQYLVAAFAREAGITKRLTPHGLRHSAITVGLDAGVSRRDMQDFARHADPKTTRLRPLPPRAQPARHLAIAHYLAAAHRPRT
jgi:integrase/recombinase XerD